MNRRLVSLVRKELTLIRRDASLRGLLLVAPIMQILLLGYAANLDVQDVPIVYFDEDRSAQSRELLHSFVNTKAFVLKSEVGSEKELFDTVERGDAEIAIHIPPHFARDVLRQNKAAQIQILVDGTRSNTAAVALAYAMQTASNFRVGTKIINYSPPEPINIHTRVFFNPELKTRFFMVPGILAILAMTITLIMTSLAIIKEKEVGTLEQIMVSPLKKHELILGKLIPFLLMSIVSLTLALVAMRVFFGIIPKGSILLLGLLSIFFLIAMLGLGLFISTITSTQQQAMMVAIFVFMFPMMILSGFIFPIVNMPAIVQLVTYAMPLRYYLVIIRGVFLKGLGFDTLWTQLLPLMAIGVVVLIIATVRFQKQIK